jgi:hypothetical protein
MKKETLREKLLAALKLLTENDGMLFSMPLEQHSDYDERKLHEVCINHRLANYLARLIIPEFETQENLFADIEFNREGINFKTVAVKGETLVVRPDVIIHNRKTGNSKFNFLIVECKKAGALESQLSEDRDKIHALMTDAKYSYQFGLQLQYGAKSISGILFFRNGAKIEAEQITYPPNARSGRPPR